MTTYTATLDDRTNGIATGSDLDREQASMRRRVWDVGPQKSTPPIRPEPPKGKNGDPDYEIAKIEFQEHLEDYEAVLRIYGRLKHEYADWQQRYGGPYEIMMWSMDAREALINDPKRYFESHPTLPNNGLPEGMKPGRAQAENIARARLGAAEIDRARERDPEFGKQGVPA